MNKAVSENRTFWTHPSVLRLAHDSEPVAEVSRRAQAMVFRAMASGWSGPPFDPIALADFLRIPIVPSDDVRDARTVPKGQDRLSVEFNPNRPKARVRFSIAHEIAHVIFPDCGEMIRHRLGRHERRSDDWQLETLCNLAAAEFLMPVGSFPDMRTQDLAIDLLLTLREQYAVSTEAVLLRAVRLTSQPGLAFTASSPEDKEGGRYILDYAIPSNHTRVGIGSGTPLPPGTVVRECTAIGFTAKGDETWASDLGRLHVECVGLPPYPGHRIPRVAGVATLESGRAQTGSLRVLRGDATSPRGAGDKIIAFVVNDKGLSWGAGFARVVQAKWPLAQKEFASWAENERPSFCLGSCFVTRLEPTTSACMMVSQHGYGPSPRPRIRYDSLQSCLRLLAKAAIERSASIHMPRIGCGEAGGSWGIVQELVETELAAKGVSVTVYDLPGRRIEKKEFQKALF